MMMNKSLVGALLLLGGVLVALLVVFVVGPRLVSASALGFIEGSWVCEQDSGKRFSADLRDLTGNSGEVTIVDDYDGATRLYSWALEGNTLSVRDLGGELYPSFGDWDLWGIEEGASSIEARTLGGTPYEISVDERSDSVRFTNGDGASLTCSR